MTEDDGSAHRAGRPLALVALITGILLFSILVGVAGLPGPLKPAAPSHPFPARTHPFGSGSTTIVVATIPLWVYPTGVAYDPALGELFVANYGSGNVSVVSDVSDSVIASVGVGTNPYSVAYDSGRAEVFVANDHSNNVSVISDRNNTVVATVPVDHNPFCAVYDAAKGEIFVSNYLSDTVSVISDSSNTVVATIGVGGNPYGEAYDPNLGEILVANQGTGNVSVISDTTNAVVATIGVGREPAGAAFDPRTNETYVANYFSNNVSVISDATNSVVANVPTGDGPQGVVYDSGASEIFVTNNLGSNVTVIGDGRHNVLVTIAVGDQPFNLAYDVATSEVFVANDNSDNMSVIFDGVTKHSVTISEQGLPPGTLWSAALNGSGLTTTAASLAFGEPDGTYLLTVGTVPGYTASPTSQTFVVSGANVSIGVTFSERFPITFTESGLPASASWSVVLSGSTSSSTGLTIGFSQPNGSYPFTVRPIAGYSASPWSGTVVLNGSPADVAISFTRVTYTVAFSENGLTQGTNWSVAFNGGSLNYGVGTIEFPAPNGSYSFSVPGVGGHPSSPSAGIVVVNGQNRSESISFLPLPTYPVDFSESGLMAGTDWSVTLNGSTNGSTGSTVSFADSNGTYGFVVTPLAGYTATPGSGTVTVLGNATTLPIVFTPNPKYNVSFGETGLPAGTLWSVTLNGSPQSSSSATIVFLEPNGSYSFTVGAVPGFVASPSAGARVVDGGRVSVGVSFIRGTASVVFDESGLPAGTPWNVTLNGTLRSTDSGSVEFVEPNGSYSFRIDPVEGFNASPSSGTVVVLGANQSRTITFTPIPVPPGTGGSDSNSTGLLGLPGIEGDLLVGGIALVVIAVAAAVLLQRRRRGPPSDPSASEEGPAVDEAGAAPAPVEDDAAVPVG